MSGNLYSTAAWKRLRAAHLSRFPFCRDCDAAGRLVIANTVDHIIPVSAGGPALPGHDGLNSYCATCHNHKTARGIEAGAVRTSKPRKGCDAMGNPIDSAHPWHAEKSLGADARTPTTDTNLELVTWA